MANCHGQALEIYEYKNMDWRNSLEKEKNNIGKLRQYFLIRILGYLGQLPTKNWKMHFESVGGMPSFSQESHEEWKLQFKWAEHFNNGIFSSEGNTKVAYALDVRLGTTSPATGKERHEVMCLTGDLSRVKLHS